MKLLDFIGYFFLIFVVLWPVSSSFAKGETRGDGRLSLYNYHEREYAEITYRQGNKYNSNALKVITYIMRSRGDGKERPIDIRLIELLDLIQDHFSAETIEIISGYRSPAYNKSLISEGHGAARESVHVQARAADIHLDEADEEKIFDYLTGIGRGGVGLYPKYAFVHVDVGKARSWREAPAKERILSGTENNLNPAWSAITDKNEYAPDEKVSVTITNSAYEKQRLVKNFWSDRFRRGEWAEHEKIAVDGRAGSLKPGASHEFVWTIPTHQKYGKHRLVIFTSKDFSVPPVYSNEFYVRKN